MDTEPQQRPRPAIVADEAGDARWLFDSLVISKVTDVDTGGRLSIFETTDPVDSFYSPVVSHDHDMTWIVLEGGVTFDFGDRAETAGPGDIVVIPREVASSHTTGEEGCRALINFTPGIPADPFVALSRPAENRALPPDAGPPRDLTELTAIWAAHGIEPVELAGSGDAPSASRV